uniref:Uncharacterized protein n=1 Tax=Ananas comosus var. bracteatus TaxID=296719 RepID=A0A6V7QY75_ANACO
MVSASSPTTKRSKHWQCMRGTSATHTLVSAPDEVTAVKISSGLFRPPPIQSGFLWFRLGISSNRWRARCEEETYGDAAELGEARRDAQQSSVEFGKDAVETRRSLVELDGGAQRSSVERAWVARHRRAEEGDELPPREQLQELPRVLVLLLIAGVVVAVAVVSRRGRVVGDRAVQSLAQGFVAGGSRTASKERAHEGRREQVDGGAGGSDDAVDGVGEHEEHDGLGAGGLGAGGGRRGAGGANDDALGGGVVSGLLESRHGAVDEDDGIIARAAEAGVDAAGDGAASSATSSTSRPWLSRR